MPTPFDQPLPACGGISKGHAVPGPDPTGDDPQAPSVEPEIGDADPATCSPVEDWTPAGRLDPLTGAWVWNGSTPASGGGKIPRAEGLPNGLPNGLRTPVAEGVFPGSPTLVLPPVLPPDLEPSAGASHAPAQGPAKHRPWQYSTGPRTPAGKQRSALNGKNRQTGLLSVRKLRAYKKGQKALLETLDHALKWAKTVNDRLQPDGP